jgi:hypothetical protein
VVQDEQHGDRARRSSRFSCTDVRGLDSPVGGVDAAVGNSIRVTKLDVAEFDVAASEELDADEDPALHLAAAPTLLLSLGGQ